MSYETAHGYPEQNIIEQLVSRNHDLLFIGDYGHRRILEMVLELNAMTRQTAIEFSGKQRLEQIAGHLTKLCIRHNHARPRH